MTDAKDDLSRYLRHSREALLWKLDGLSGYDVRRPLTPTGTNLLGLVKHVASVASGYLGEVFDRPFPEPPPWFADGAGTNADMYAAADETRDELIAFWHRAWQHSDATVAALPLDAVGHVPWWPPERREVTLHRILVHLVSEVDRHAGHADIVRELIDGGAGRRPDSSNLPDESPQWWQEYRATLESIARQATD